MATTPPTNSGQPNHTHVVFRIAKKKPVSADAPVMTFIDSHEGIGSAAEAAKAMAESDAENNYVVFEAVQVFAQVAKVEMIYSRRG